jgi:hypothetical protein
MKTSNDLSNDKMLYVSTSKTSGYAKLRLSPREIPDRKYNNSTKGLGCEENRSQKM